MAYSNGASNAFRIVKSKLLKKIQKNSKKVLTQ